MTISRGHDPLWMTLTRPLYRTGRAGYRQLRRLKNRLCNLIDPPLIILIYHRVSELPFDPEMLAVSPENFRSQLEYLRQRYRIVRFEEDWLVRKEPAVAVTFDDGYADNFLEALPILEELQVPATFFVSTGHLGNGENFWWHQLDAILLKARHLPSRFSLTDSRFGRTWASDSPQNRQRLYAELCQLMRRIGPDRQANWLAQLQTWADVHAINEAQHRVMTQEELSRLAASPWATIGAHTVSHAALSVLPDEQQRQEIFSSKRILEEVTGKPITTFSYPFGRRCEYNRTSIRLCREAGFGKVAANFPGQVHRWTDPLQLPRHLIRNWDVQVFATELEDFWTQ